MITPNDLATLDEIGEAIIGARLAGNKELASMHCIKAFPTGLQKPRLDNTRILRETFDVDVCSSGNTLVSEAVLLSIHFEATLIEQHFIVPREEGAESKFSLKKEELTADSKTFDCGV